MAITPTESYINNALVELSHLMRTEAAQVALAPVRRHLEAARRDLQDYLATTLKEA